MGDTMSTDSVESNEEKFVAEDYRNVPRKDLIYLVGDGILNRDNLLEIAELEPQGKQDRTYYYNRVCRTIRYWLAARRNEVDGGTVLPDGANGLLHYYENRNWFQSILGGWKMYGTLWDIQKHPPYDIYPLAQSIEEQWNEIIREQAVPIEEVIGIEEGKEVGQLKKIAGGKISKNSDKQKKKE